MQQNLITFCHQIGDRNLDLDTSTGVGMVDEAIVVINHRRRQVRRDFGQKQRNGHFSRVSRNIACPVGYRVIGGACRTWQAGQKGLGENNINRLVFIFFTGQRNLGACYAAPISLDDVAFFRPE